MEAVMAETRRRCRYRQTQMQAQERQNQMQAQEWPRAAVVAPLVVQELLVVQEPARASLVAQVPQPAAVAKVPLVVQEPQLAAVAQPLVVQVPLAVAQPLVEPHTQQQRPRRPQATGPPSPPSAEPCEQGRA
jgi:hypothetical protein